MKRWFLDVSAALFLAAPAGATVYYSDANAGDDRNPGTLASPFRTFDKCVLSLRAPGDVCDLRQGVYSTSSPVVTASGAPGLPIEVRGHAGEAVWIRQGAPVAWSRVWSNGTSLAMYAADFDYDATITRQRSMSWYYERGIQLWNDHALLDAGNGLSSNFFSAGGAAKIIPFYPPDPGATSTKISSAAIGSPLGPIPANGLVGSIAWINGGTAVNWYPKTVRSSGTNPSDPSKQWFTVDGESTEPMGPSSPFYLIGSKYLLTNPWEWGWDAAAKKLYILAPLSQDPSSFPIRVQTTSVALTLRGANYWSIHDLNLEGVTPTVDGCRYLEYHHLSVVQPGIVQFTEKAFDYGQHSGIVLPDDSRLHHSSIQSCWGRCVDVNGSRDTVENNAIRDHTLRGQFEGGVSLQKPDGLLRQNAISTGNHCGVFITSLGWGAVVRRNLVEYPALGVSDGSAIDVGSHTGTVVIDSNLFSAPGYSVNGIMLDQASSNNDIFHNISDLRGPFITFNQNPFSGNYSSRNNRVGSNTLISNDYFALFRGIQDLSGSFFKDNILSGVAASGPYESNPVVRQSADIADYLSKGLQWQGNLSAGTPPLLMAPSFQDYRLQAGSPAIDYGTTYLPGQVFNGAAPDAGAVESGTQQWVFGPWDPPPPPNQILGFEDPALWHVIWNGPPVQLTRSGDFVEGSWSMRMVPNGYVALESAPLDQNMVKGFSMLQLWVRLSNPANPWWIGQLQFFFDSPSLGIYNQWVGQVDLREGWGVYTVVIPSSLGDQLKGKTFSDLRVRMAVNVPMGTGAMLFDDLQFAP